MDLDIAELEALLPVFVAESEPHLARLEEALVALEGDRGDSPDLSTALRAMHTLKGSASMLGLDAISEVAHAGEDVFAALKTGDLRATRQIVSLLLAATDAITTMVAGVERGHLPQPGGNGALIEQLRASLAKHDETDPPVTPEGPPQADGGQPIAVVERDGRPTPAPGATEAGPPAPDPDIRHDTAAARMEQPEGRPRRTLRIGVDKLDRLVDLAHELALERRMLLARASALVPAHRAALRDLVEEGDHVVEDLRDTVMNLRLVPLGPTLRRFVRAVRDIAAATGKHAQLAIEGEDVEVDTSVAEALIEPLTHLVRNAMDHGIEPGAERVARGKAPSGTITLRTRREATGILIEVEDDGGGLSRAKLARRARAWGIPAADELSDGELQALVFEPGFSTAEAVSELSGRGVGMDIVRRQIESLRGTVSLRSREGAGTTVGLRVPLTIATLEGLRVRVGDGTYIVPLASVRECGDAPAGLAPEGIVELGGETLPYVRLRHAFGESSPPPAREDMLVVRHGSTVAGLVVDEILGAAETMIRPLDARLRSGMSGSAVLDDGSIGLVLDVMALLEGLVGPDGRRAGLVDVGRSP